LKRCFYITTNESILTESNFLRKKGKLLHDEEKNSEKEVFFQSEIGVFAGRVPSMELSGIFL
jgi:hypothetical protein